MKQYSYLIVYQASYLEYIEELKKDFTNTLTGNAHITSSRKLTYEDLDRVRQIIQDGCEKKLINIVILNIIEMEEPDLIRSTLRAVQGDFIR